MRSAIFYPDSRVRDPDFLRSSLLLWDELKVIDPAPWRPREQMPHDVAEAWEVFGSTIEPTDRERHIAHQKIEDMLDEPEFLDFVFQDVEKGPLESQSYDMFNEKLFGETWRLLQERARFMRLDSGDYRTNEAVATAIMSKLAEACAGTAFARVTNRARGYALSADRDLGDLSDQVVPVTLKLIDLRGVSLKAVTEFRKKEFQDKRYRTQRHRYLQDVEEHLVALRQATTERDREELDRIFEERMAEHLQDLKDGLRTNKVQLAVQAIVSLVVGAGSILTAGIGLGASGGAVKMIGDFFKGGMSYRAEQRALMAKNPMAYMYMLGRTET